MNVELTSEPVAPRQGGGRGRQSDQSVASDISGSVVVNSFTMVCVGSELDCLLVCILGVTQ